MKISYCENCGDLMKTMASDPGSFDQTLCPACLDMPKATRSKRRAKLRDSDAIPKSLLDKAREPQKND